MSISKTTSTQVSKHLNIHVHLIYQHQSTNSSSTFNISSISLFTHILILGVFGVFMNNPQNFSIHQIPTLNQEYTREKQHKTNHITLKDEFPWFLIF
ncbi:hypothetical protein Lal_00029064 [Lupinus albus]|nr:hypothetical protein Lal_00029064 [Lupinus albus]